MKKHLLGSSLVAAFFFVQLAMAMELDVEERGLGSVDLREVEVPQLLSYVGGRFNLQLVSLRDYAGRCDSIDQDIRIGQATRDQLSVLYRILPNFIWRHPDDECHILIEVKKSDDGNVLKYLTKALCAIYCDKAGLAYHVCNRGMCCESRDFSNIPQSIDDCVALSLCYMAGIFSMCLREDLRARFIECKKQTLKPFAILDCGHINAYPLAEHSVCTVCQKKASSAIATPFAGLSLSRDMIESIYSGDLPAPM